MPISESALSGYANFVRIAVPGSCRFLDRALGSRIRYPPGMGLTVLKPWKLFAAAALLLGAALANFGQDATQPKDKKDDKKKEPAPLFGGKMGIKSSSGAKETASLGFNGIDP